MIDPCKLNSWFVDMRKMTGVLGLTLLVLVLSPSLSGALWPEEKKPATSGEAAKEYAKAAVRDAKDATANVGEGYISSQPLFYKIAR